MAADEPAWQPMGVAVAEEKPMMLTVPEAAEALRLGEHTVRLLVSHGDPASVRIGRAVRILRSDLEDFVQRQRRDRDG
jgi:excisionase family DNA binding protein